MNQVNLALEPCDAAQCAFEELKRNLTLDDLSTHILIGDHITVIPPADVVPS